MIGGVTRGALIDLLMIKEDEHPLTVNAQPTSKEFPLSPYNADYGKSGLEKSRHWFILLRQ